MKLMEALDDDDSATAARDVDKPFLMSVEDVFTITGRGTVATGRVERGKVKVGDAVEIVGIQDTRKSVATGLEMFRKLLDESEAGDNIGVLLRGVEKNQVERGQVIAAPGTINAAQEIQRAGVYTDERRRRTSHAVLQRIQAAVLFQDDGRDGYS